MNSASNAGSFIFVDDAHTFGGAQIALGSAVRALVDYSDAHVVLVTTQRTQTRIQHILGDTARIRYVSCPPALPLNLFTFPLRVLAYRRLIKILLKDNPESEWIFNLPDIEFCLAPLTLLRLRGIKPLAWLHNPERSIFFNGRGSAARRALSHVRDLVADKLVFRQYSVLVTPSIATSMTASERGGTRKAPLFEALYPVIRDSGVPPMTAASAEQRGILDLWMIGRIDIRHKNNLLAIQALRWLLERGHNARLSFVGEGPDREYCVVAARELNVEDAVRFVGWRADPWVDIPADAIILMPSRWESFGLVSMEAAFRNVRLVLSPLEAFVEVYPPVFVAEENTAACFAKTVLRVAGLTDEKVREMYADTKAKSAPRAFVDRFISITSSIAQS